MIRRLINRLQGKVWSANCGRCPWTAGRDDLSKQQAYNRARLHSNSAHVSQFGIFEWNKYHRMSVV